jgi:hypothetical protein
VLVSAPSIIGSSATRYDLKKGNNGHFQRLRGGEEGALGGHVSELVSRYSADPIQIPFVSIGPGGKEVRTNHQIEIDVAGKYRVRVGCGFDGPALRRVLDVLERR